MTDKELKRLPELQKRLARLRREEDRARAEIEDLAVIDTVRGSRAERPYDLHTMAVSGTPDTAQARTAQRKFQQIQARRAATEMECIRLSRFIEQIQDPRLHDLFYQHYQEGKTWQRIAIDYGWDESWPRHQARKYLLQSEKSGFRGV